MSDVEFEYVRRKKISYYKIDWDTVKSVDDIKNILQALNIEISGDNPKFELINKHLCLDCPKEFDNDIVRLIGLSI